MTARPAAPITDVLSTHRPNGLVGASPAVDVCPLCGDEGFTFHVYAGAVELDGPCPALRHRTDQEAAA